MPEPNDTAVDNLSIANEWCKARGSGWSVTGPLGVGGTASVFSVVSPEGPRALKLYSAPFSAGERGAVESLRIEQQVEIGRHDCKSLVQVYDGGIYEGRLYLVMSRAPGRELEKCLGEVPRAQIRRIVDQVARAVLFLRSKGLCHRDIKAANIFISDDFTEATLLDISVVRNIHDPIGIGTDHEGQLPVVATARYWPPEYLFRLLDPSPALWDALSIYQMGALLHDIIMRKPLFDLEYRISAENRYRFAWAVATKIPEVEGDDVDQDLIFLCKSALQKDWKRRSEITLEEFLEDFSTQRLHALQLLGLAGIRSATTSETEGSAARFSRTRAVAEALEAAVLRLLKNKGVMAQHQVRAVGSQNGLQLAFRWTNRELKSNQRLEIEIVLQDAPPTAQGRNFFVSATLSAILDGKERSASIDLPVVQDGQLVETVILKNVDAALSKLAFRLLQK